MIDVSTPVPPDTPHFFVLQIDTQMQPSSQVRLMNRIFTEKSIAISQHILLRCLLKNHIGLLVFLPGASHTKLLFNLKQNLHCQS